MTRRTYSPPGRNQHQQTGTETARATRVKPPQERCSRHLPTRAASARVLGRAATCLEDDVRDAPPRT